MFFKDIDKFKRSECYRKKPREVYKAQCGNEILLIKHSPDDVNELYEEYKNTKYALKILKDKVHLPKPLYFNRNKCKLALEYIENRCTLENNEFNLDLYYRAIDSLTFIHNSKEGFFKRLQDKRTFSNLIKDQIDRYTESVEIEFSVDLRQKLQKAVRFLKNNISEEDNVIAHGDFKPNNLLILKESSDIYVIDWRDFGYSIRQYDLGNLLFNLDDNTTYKLTQYYLQKIGLKTEVNTFAKTSRIIAGLILAEASKNLCEKYDNELDQWCKMKNSIFQQFNHFLETTNF